MIRVNAEKIVFKNNKYYFDENDGIRLAYCLKLKNEQGLGDEEANRMSVEKYPKPEPEEKPEI